MGVRKTILNLLNVEKKAISLIYRDLQACFDYLYGLVRNTSSEPILSSIINRLICIRDDQAIRLGFFCYELSSF